jgi:preprotein translocase subunit YajC
MEGLFGGMGDFVSMWPIILMVIIFYFLLYRPQKKQQKKHQEMMDSLKKDSKIVTVGGIIGTVVSLDEKYAMIRIADKVEIKVTRGAINQVLTKDSDVEDAK